MAHSLSRISRGGARPPIGFLSVRLAVIRRCALVHLFKTYRSTSSSLPLAPAPIPCPMIHSRARSPPFQNETFADSRRGGRKRRVVGGRWWRSIFGRCRDNNRLPGLEKWRSSLLLPASPHEGEGVLGGVPRRTSPHRALAAFLTGVYVSVLLSIDGLAHSDRDTSGEGA